MKNILGISIAIITLVLTQSCKEVLPARVVQTIILDTNYIDNTNTPPQPKAVLVEEFTGASCVNCPDGHLVLRQLDTIYGSKVIFTGIHSGALATPVKPTDQDLRSKAADELTAHFGVTAMPVAILDRKEIDGSRIVSRDQWISKVGTLVNSPVKVNIDTKTSYSSINDWQELEVGIKFLESYSGQVNYSIMLLENKIITSQKYGSQELDDYEQEHVLRKMYTNSLGNILGTDPIKGKTFKKKFALYSASDKLNPKWNQDNLYIVCIVTDNETGEVLQASRVNFK